jgi:tetratricopeptide (TPR) repeat protein
VLDTDQNFQEALKLFSDKKFKSCFLKLISISVKFSNELGYLRLLEQVQAALLDEQARLKTLRVIADKSSSVDDRINYMYCLFEQKQINSSLDEALKLQTFSMTIVQKILVCKHLVKIYSIENDFEGLEEVCLEMQSLGASGADLDYSQALIQAGKGDLEKAIVHLRRAVTMYPQFDTGWSALGLYHYKKGDFELAKANLAKALDINADNSTALKYMTAWVDDGSSDEINSTLRKVNYYLQKHNFDQEITTCHAKLLLKKGQSRWAQIETEKLSYYFGK